MQRDAPLSFVAFPTEDDSAAAVIVVRLEQKVFAVSSQDFEQINFFAVKIGFHFPHSPRPRNMFFDHFDLFIGKKMAYFLSLKIAKLAFLCGIFVRNEFAIKTFPSR